MAEEVKPVSLADLMRGRTEVIEFEGHKIQFTFNPNAITPRIHRDVEALWEKMRQPDAPDFSVGELTSGMAEALAIFVTDTGIEGVGPGEMDSAPSALVSAMFSKVMEAMRPNPESGETSAAVSEPEAK